MNIDFKVNIEPWLFGSCLAAFLIIYFVSKSQHRTQLINCGLRVINIFKKSKDDSDL